MIAQPFSFLIITLLLTMNSCQKEDLINLDEVEIAYTFPEESEAHEGTWLQWPHHYEYGIDFRNDIEQTWIDITKALIQSEKVHIIAYNQIEKQRIEGILNVANVSLAQVDFFVIENDDFWIRDNGPIFVRDLEGNLVIQDWGFNGWGNKTSFEKCDRIPSKIGIAIGKPVIDLNDIMVNEGGSVEMDGYGTLLACKSSIINNNRNPGMTQNKVEAIFKEYLGVSNFVWLEGVKGSDITDMHIDGFARFANSTTIVSMSSNDLDYWYVTPSDETILKSARNIDGEAYQIIEIPLTQNEVITTYGTNEGKASYINYYIGNTVVLVPNYGDPNDAIANNIIQNIYPNRTVIGIESKNVYALGGMVHCSTQQQPLE
jgi:agmatine deiminase